MPSAVGHRVPPYYEQVYEEAHRRTPPTTIAFVDSTAGDGRTLTIARDAVTAVEFVPRFRVDVSDVKTQTRLVIGDSSSPFAVGPSGWTSALFPGGERLIAEVAKDLGLVYVMANFSCVHPIDIPGGQRNFQFYVTSDDQMNADKLDELWDSGVRVLWLTLDVPRMGERRLDEIVGVKVPPVIPSEQTLRDYPQYRSYWEAQRRAWIERGGKPLRPALFQDIEGSMHDITSKFVPVTPKVYLDILANWKTRGEDARIIVKAPLSAADARWFAENHVDGMVPSVHGGRQGQRVKAPFHLVPEVVAECRSYGADVYVDTGIYEGVDVVAGVALGANAALVSRLVLYALCAGGKQCVADVLSAVKFGVENQMAQIGAQTVGQLDHTFIEVSGRQKTIADIVPSSARSRGGVLL